jgi:hypothetical protein
MEVEVSSLAVHSNIYTEDPSICERTGVSSDELQDFSSCMHSYSVLTQQAAYL